MRSYLRGTATAFVSRTLFFCFFVLNAALLFPQSNVNVPADDPAYAHLSNLVAWGLVESDISGTKPFPRQEFARLILAAQTKLEQSQTPPSALVHNSMRYLSVRFRDGLHKARNKNHRTGLRLRPFSTVRVEYINFDSPARALPQDNIDAVVQPFVAYREGRTFVNGQNAAFESSHWLSYRDAVSFYYQGRVFLTDPRAAGGNSDFEFETLRMYFLFSKWNLNLLIGKDAFVWGTGWRRNLSFSQNAEPVGSFNTLPLLKLSNQEHSRLPWIFRGLGPLHFEFFIARLEKDRRDFARPLLIGNRLNFKSGKNSEFGLSHAFILGGENFPINYNFWEALAEFFFIRAKQGFVFNIGVDPGRQKEPQKTNIANHLMGFDLKFRFPSLRYTEFYHEFYFEDMTFNIETTLKRNLGYYGGIYIPRLTSDGKFALRLEYVHTSTIFYTSTLPFDSGFTNERRIFGNDLGPLGNELFGQVDFKSNPETTWSFFSNFQSRGVDKNTRAELADAPNEKRLQMGLQVTKLFGVGISVTADARYQRVFDFANVARADKDTYFGGISVRAHNIFGEPGNSGGSDHSK